MYTHTYLDKFRLDELFFFSFSSTKVIGLIDSNLCVRDFYVGTLQRMCYFLKQTVRIITFLFVRKLVK